MTRDAQSPLVGKDLSRTYRVLRVLCEGGMSVVLAAERLRPPRRMVAVKLLRPVAASNPIFAARFQKESEVLSALEHPHVVRMLDSGTTDEGRPYHVTELLRGETLRQRLARVGRLAPDQALELAQQAGGALQAMHERGLLHRGLHPGSLFLQDDPGALLQLKLLDFNLAARLEDLQAHPPAPEVIGVEGYMSPEQARGELRALDSRSDQFLLGLTAYEALAGQHPFDGRDDEERQEAILHGRPRPVSGFVPDLAGPVREALDRALARGPEQRFPDVRAFVHALTQAITGAKPDTLRGFESVREATGNLAIRPEATPSPAREPGPAAAAQPAAEEAPRRTRVLASQPASSIRLPSTLAPVLEEPRVTRVLLDLTQAPMPATVVLPQEACSARNEVDPGAPTVTLDAQGQSTVLLSTREEPEEEVVPRGLSGPRLLVPALFGLALVGGLLLLMTRDDRMPSDAPAPPAQPAAVAQVIASKPPEEPSPPAPIAQPEPVVEPPAAREPAPPAEPGIVPEPQAPSQTEATPAEAPARPVAAAALQVAALSKGEPVLADIYLDGKRVGQTPLLLRRVSPGRHVVTARGPDSEQATRTVSLRPGQRVSMVLELAP